MTRTTFFTSRLGTLPQPQPVTTSTIDARHCTTSTCASTKLHEAMYLASKYMRTRIPAIQPRNQPLYQATHRQRHPLVRAFQPRQRAQLEGAGTKLHQTEATHRFAHPHQPTRPQQPREVNQRRHGQPLAHEMKRSHVIRVGITILTSTNPARCAHLRKFHDNGRPH